MSSGRIQDLGRYCSPHSLLVATPDGLVRLHCPFAVMALRDIGPFAVGDRVDVRRVKVDPDLQLLYEIGGRDYFYYHFAITL